jgi:hypothetical protein
MGVTITAVPAAANANPPAQHSPTERALLDFVASQQNSPIYGGMPMYGLPHLANPTALAGEVFSHLQVFFEKWERTQKVKITPSPGADGDGASVMLASMDSGQPPAAQYALARSLEPADAAGAASPKAGIGITELRRTMELALQSLNQITEAGLVTHAAALVPRSVSTLLKSQ